MKTTKKLLAAALAVFSLAFFAGVFNETPAGAQHTDTFNTISNAALTGGLPPCISFNGTHGDDSTLTVTLPAGFVPKFGIYIDNAASGAAPVVYHWTAEMADAGLTVMLSGGSTAFTATPDVDLDDSTAASFVVDADATTNGGAYYGWLCRF